MEFSVSELMNLFGSLLGLIMVFLITIYMKGKKDVRVALILVLIIGALTIFLGSLDYSGKIRYIPHLIRVDSPIHYLIAPSMFFYILAILKADFRFRTVHLLHLIPFVVNLIIFMPLYISSASFKLDYYDEYMLSGSYIMPVNYLIKTISMWAYFIAELVVFKRYLQQEGRFRINDKFLIIWVIVFLSIQFICNNGYLLDHLTGMHMFADPYRFALNMTTFLVLSIALGLLFFPRIVFGNILKSEIKYRKSTLDENRKEMILSRWLAFIDGESKPYLDPQLSLNKVAEQLDTTAQSLSQVINERTGMNFNDCINAKRIIEAEKILTSGDSRKITIEAIALLSGFNSKSPFYAAFKKHKGITPREFIKIMAEA